PRRFRSRPPSDRFKSDPRPDRYNPYDPPCAAAGRPSRRDRRAGRPGSSRPGGWYAASVAGARGGGLRPDQHGLFPQRILLRPQPPDAAAPQPVRGPAPDRGRVGALLDARPPLAPQLRPPRRRHRVTILPSPRNGERSRGEGSLAFRET